MKRKIVHVFQTAMNQAGINATSADRSGLLYRRRTIIIILQLFGLSALWGYAIINRNDYPRMIQGIGFATANVANAASYVYFVAKSNGNQELLKSVDDNVYTYADEQSILPSYNWISKEENMMIMFISMFAYQMMCILIFLTIPTICFLYTGTVNCAPLWIPVNSNLLIYASIVLIVINSSFLFYLKLAFPLFISFEFQRQNTRLCTALATAEHRSLSYAIEKSNAVLKQKSKPNESDTSSPSLSKPLENTKQLQIMYRENMEKNILQCICHYQQLLR